METVKEQVLTLYQRLGGLEGITAIVDDVVEEHMNNPAISARFIPYHEMPARLADIKKHTVHFFCAGSGGPQQYSGRDMPTTHRGMNISEAEYMNVMDDILAVLERKQMDEQTIKDVLAILYSLKGQIIGV